jgi:cytochrome c peroxidase
MCTTLRTLYVKNYTGRTVSAIDISGWMHEGAQNPDIQSINTVAVDKFNNEELLGLKLFYQARNPDISPEGYISCASCHAGGGNDGMTWDVTHMGEGLRNTMSLNGASGTRFGDLHWSGNFDEVQDFEIQIEKLNGGEGLISGVTFTTQSPLTLATSGQSADLDALATYVNSLGKDRVKRSPYRTYTGSLTEAAERGRNVFNNNGCADCHAGAAFRDGLRHDVGTTKASSGTRLGGAALTEIRTPSLIQLWETGPFFHDGSAETLQDVLNQSSHPSHAVGLTSADESDLIEYLLSIDRELYIEDDAVFPDF